MHAIFISKVDDLISQRPQYTGYPPELTTFTHSHPPAPLKI